MTPDEFIARYRITSRTGRLYTREALLSACSRDPAAKVLKVRRAELAAVVDDDAFLRPMSGMVPARVTEAVVLEALTRRPMNTASAADVSRFAPA